MVALDRLIIFDCINLARIASKWEDETRNLNWLSYWINLSDLDDCLKARDYQLNLRERTERHVAACFLISLMFTIE